MIFLVYIQRGTDYCKLCHETGIPGFIQEVVCFVEYFAANTGPHLASRDEWEESVSPFFVTKIPDFSEIAHETDTPGFTLRSFVARGVLEEFGGPLLRVV